MASNAWYYSILLKRATTRSSTSPEIPKNLLSFRRAVETRDLDFRKTVTSRILRPVNFAYMMEQGEFVRNFVLPSLLSFLPVYVPTNMNALNSGTKRGIIGAKGSNRGSSKGSRNTDGSSPERPIDAGHQGSSNSGGSDAPPAIVLRAPKVQAQKRLHGKPASSFFARAHAAGVSLAPTEGTVLDEPRFPSPTVPSLASTAGVAPPTAAEQQAAMGSRATVVEYTSAVANLVVKPRPTPPAAGNESAASVASAVSTVSLASNVSTCASAHGSCTSTASDGHDTAGSSFSGRLGERLEKQRGGHSTELRAYS